MHEERDTLWHFEISTVKYRESHYVTVLDRYDLSTYNRNSQNRLTHPITYLTEDYYWVSLYHIHNYFEAMLLLIYTSSVRRLFREDQKPFIDTSFHNTSAYCRRVFAFMCDARQIPFKREPRLTYKFINTAYLRWLKLKTQKFISQQYLKFDLCDTGVVFYQLIDQVNWKLIMV